MPYLQSNEDANENPLFNQALLFGAAITAAGSFGSMAYKDIKGLAGNVKGLFSGKSTKTITDPLNKRTVLGNLYGNKNSMYMKDYSSMFEKDWIGSKEINGPQYGVNNSIFGKPKLKRTDGSVIDRVKENTFKMNKDLNNVNKSIKELTKEGYGATKLDIYSELMNNKGKLNFDTADAINATKNIHGSKINMKNISKNGYDYKTSNGINIKQDLNKTEIDVINNIWGAGDRAIDEAYITNAKNDLLKESYINNSSGYLPKDSDDKIRKAVQKDKNANSIFNDNNHKKAIEAMKNDRVSLENLTKSYRDRNYDYIHTPAYSNKYSGSENIAEVINDMRNTLGRERIVKENFKPKRYNIDQNKTINWSKNIKYDGESGYKTIKNSFNGLKPNSKLSIINSTGNINSAIRKDVAKNATKSTEKNITKNIKKVLKK